MNNLKLKGDVQKWQVECMQCIEEIFESKCTMMDYALMCVMKSLDGRARTMQYKIADDINKQEITDQTNVYDMVQSYASSMASVGENNSENKVNAATSGKEKDKESDTDEFSGNCYVCGKKGHKSFECPDRHKKSRAKPKPKHKSKKKEVSSSDESSSSSDCEEAGHKKNSKTKDGKVGVVASTAIAPFTKEEINMMMEQFKTQRAK